MTHTVHLIGNWYLVNIKARHHQKMMMLGLLKRKIKREQKLSLGVQPKRNKIGSSPTPKGVSSA